MKGLPPTPQSRIPNQRPPKAARGGRETFGTKAHGSPGGAGATCACLPSVRAPASRARPRPAKRGLRTIRPAPRARPRLSAHRAWLWGVVRPGPTPEGGAQDVGCVAKETRASWAGESARNLLCTLFPSGETSGAQRAAHPRCGGNARRLWGAEQQSRRRGRGPSVRLGAAAPPRGPEAGGAGLSRDHGVWGRRCWAVQGTSLYSERMFAGVPDAMWGFLLPLESGPGAREGEGGR